MENFKIEKFVLYLKADLTITNTEDESEILLIKLKTGYLFTIAAFYFFDTNDIKNDETEIEKFLIFKMPIEDYYLSNYDNNSIFIFTSLDNSINVKIDIKEYYKELLNIYLLLEGYKSYCLNYEYELSSFSLWINFVIDCLTQSIFISQDNSMSFSSMFINSLGVSANNNISKNFGTFVVRNYVNYSGKSNYDKIVNSASRCNSSSNSYCIGNSLIINEDFFSISNDALSFLLHYLNRIDRYDVTYKFDEESKYESFKEVFQLTHRFFHEFFANKIRQDLTDDIIILNEFSKMHFIKILRFNNNNIDDSGFLNLIEIISNCEFLQEIEVSDNKITAQSISFLSRYFIKEKKMIYLEKMILCKNLIESVYIKDFFKNSFDNLLYLQYIDLSDNYIDNDCLLYLDLTVKTITKPYNIQDEIIIDLRGNRIDSFYIRNKYFQWKPDLDMMDKADRNCTLMTLIENLSKNPLKINIKVDPIKHNKEFKHINKDLFMTNSFLGASNSMITKNIRIYARKVNSDLYNCK